MATFEVFLVATVGNFASEKKTLRDWTSKPEATIPEASYVTAQSRSPNSHESNYLKSVDWVTGAGNPRWVGCHVAFPHAREKVILVKKIVWNRSMPCGGSLRRNPLRKNRRGSHVASWSCWRGDWQSRYVFTIHPNVCSGKMGMGFLVYHSQKKWRKWWG
jgi:hypothetical protein